jgi:superkiller protein 3
LPEAVAAFRKAVKLDPNYAQTHYNLGLVLRAQRKSHEAIAEYCKVLEIDPTHIDAHLELGAILCDDLRDYDSAAAHIRKAIEIEPKSALAYHNLANPLRAQGKVPEAIACYRKALEIDRRFVMAHLRLGEILCDDLSDYDNAAACFRKAIDLDPNSDVAHSDHGVALIGQGKLPEAVARFRKAIELNPTSAHHRINLGKALWDQGKPDEAIDAYREALRREPGNAAARNLLVSAVNTRAWALATDPDPRKRDPARAVDLARKGVGLAPRSASHWKTLGAAHYRAGNWEESRAALQKSLDLGRRGDSVVGFFLAMAHWRLGHEDEARRWYDRAAEWMEQSQPANRAEAAQLLGVEKKRD